MELIELMVFRGGRRDFFFRAGATRGATRGDSDRFVTPSKSHKGPVLCFLEQTGKFPGWLEGVWERDGTPGKSCGTDQRPLPGAPSNTSEGPGRPRDGTPGCVCLDTTPSSDRFGTERQAKPAGRIKGDFRAHLRIQVRAPAGRLRDGTPGKTCGTDQRRLPGAPSDAGKVSAGRGGARSGFRLCSVGPKHAPVCTQSA